MVCLKSEYGLCSALQSLLAGVTTALANVELLHLVLEVVRCKAIAGFGGQWEVPVLQGGKQGD